MLVAVYSEWGTVVLQSVRIVLSSFVDSMGNMFSVGGSRNGPFVPLPPPNILVSAGQAVAGYCGLVARGQPSSRGVGCDGDMVVRSGGQVYCRASLAWWTRVTSSCTPRRPPPGCVRYWLQQVVHVDTAPSACSPASSGCVGGRTGGR